MANDKNSDSLRETIRSFRDTIKQQILTVLQWAWDSKKYIKETAEQSAKWIVQHAGRTKQIIRSAIQWSLQTVKDSVEYTFRWTMYFLTNAPRLISRAISSGWDLLLKGLKLGYDLTAILLDGIWQTLKQIARGIKYIIAQFPHFITRLSKLLLEILHTSFDFAKRLIKSTFKLLKSILVGMKDLVVESIQLLARFSRYVFNNIGPIVRSMLRDFYHFIKNIPLFIKQLARIGWDVTVFFKECIIDLFRTFYHLGKILLSNVGNFLKTVMANLVPFTKWLLKKCASYLLKGIGLLLGIGSALFELGVDACKSIFGKQAKPEAPDSSHPHRHRQNRSATHAPAITPQFRRQSKHSAVETAPSDDLLGTSVELGNKRQAMRMANR